MQSIQYLTKLQAILDTVKNQEAQHIRDAGLLLADALSHGGVLHTFGSGHSHLLAEEVFFRAGGLVPVNPILDDRLSFLHGALESTRAERTSGYAREILSREDIRSGDIALLISNSGRNAVPVEMALEMKERQVKVIVVTNLDQSKAAASRHSSGKRLFELADVCIDNCVPEGDAVLALPGVPQRIGPGSTVAGAAIVNSIMIEAAAEMSRLGLTVPVFPSANVGSQPDTVLADLMKPYQDRIRYFRSI